MAKQWFKSGYKVWLEDICGLQNLPNVSGKGIGAFFPACSEFEFLKDKMGGGSYK